MPIYKYILRGGLKKTLRKTAQSVSADARSEDSIWSKADFYERQSENGEIFDIQIYEL